MATVSATLKSARISPKKVGVIMNLVRGLPLEDAKYILAFDRTKASSIILKVLKSAQANAVNNMGLNPADLYVSEIWVSPGPMAKRIRFAGRSHIRPILKRTSHIYIKLATKESK